MFKEMSIQKEAASCAPTGVSFCKLWCKSRDISGAPKLVSKFPKLVCGETQHGFLSMAPDFATEWQDDLECKQS